jgi:hypothetical protein
VDQETDAELLGRLRAGDERAFATLVGRHRAVMLHLAAGYVPSMLPKLRLPLRRSRDIACQQAVELVTDYLEGELSRADRRRFAAHLAGCPHCTEYLAQMRATIELTGDLTADDLTPQMQDEFIALYRQWSAGQDGT